MSSSDLSGISTTFTPPTTCTQDHLTLMEYYQYEIWLNYPVPVPGTTSTACYPSQYVSSYLSAEYITTTLPPISPLVCPAGYGTILSTTVSSSGEYVACCPSSWLLALPTTSTIPNRPAYGGTCYSDISTVVVTAYDNSSVIATSTWVASTSGAQAYALVMEGYAAANATSGNGIFASSTSSSSMQISTKPGPTTTVFLASSTSTSSVIPSKNSLSGGAIAGVVIGCITGLLIFAGAGLFFLRRRRQARAAAANGPETGAGRLTPAGVEMEGEAFNDKDAKLMPYAKPAMTGSHTEMPGYEAAHEVESPVNRPVEMQGEGYVDSEATRMETETGPHEIAGSGG